MPFYLTKSEQRALLLVSLIIISAILFEWLRPHQIHTKIYDYSLQDSLFKALSSPQRQPAKKQDLLQTAASSSSKQEKIRPALRPKSININTADKEELTRLPRIGHKIADRIINYRKTNGAFKDIEEIKSVKGIGNKTFERLSPYITVK